MAGNRFEAESQPEQVYSGLEHQARQNQRLFAWSSYPGLRQSFHMERLALCEPDIASPAGSRD
jgi:hypothetical protein